MRDETGKWNEWNWKAMLSIFSFFFFSFFFLLGLVIDRLDSSSAIAIDLTALEPWMG